MKNAPNFTPVIHENESWVLFSDLLNAANLSDPKAANTKCEIEPAIERTALPGFDQRERYIKMRDIPAFLGRYRRISPEQSAAFARILSHLPDGLQGELPGRNAGQNPGKAKRKPEKLPGQPTEKAGNKPGENPGADFWNSWGERWGEFYASPLVAYLALTGLVIALAVLHT